MAFLSTQNEIKDLLEEQLKAWKLMALLNCQKPFTLGLVLGKQEKQGKLPDAEPHSWKTQYKLSTFSSKPPILCLGLMVPSPEPFISLSFTLRLKASFFLPHFSLPMVSTHSLKATCSVLPTCLRTLIEYPTVTWWSHSTSDLTENAKGA